MGAFRRSLATFSDAPRGVNWRSNLALHRNVEGLDELDRSLHVEQNRLRSESAQSGVSRPVTTFTGRTDSQSGNSFWDLSGVDSVTGQTFAAPLASMRGRASPVASRRASGPSPF